MSKNSQCLGKQVGITQRKMRSKVRGQVNLLKFFILSFPNLEFIIAYLKDDEIYKFFYH